MKKFQVWIEGYAATGEHSPASLIGEVEAENFDEACIKLCGDKLDKNDDGSYIRSKIISHAPAAGKERTDWFMDDNIGNFSIWSCKLYDNEKEARKYFG